MQDNSDLRNLVLKSLDSKGILSHLKAQVRSSIYNILESQEDSTKKKSGFGIQNPVSLKLSETPEGQNMLDLINEFLLFYKMDYTQSVFTKETNLSQNITREKLIKNLALKENIDPQKPILMHIVLQYLKGMMGVFQSNASPVNNTVKNVEPEKPKSKKNEEPKTNNFFKKKNNENAFGASKNEETTNFQPFSKNKPEENKITSKFNNFKSTNDPYSYDIPLDENKDKDLFTKKKETTGNIKFNNNFAKYDENSEVIEEDLMVQEDDLEDDFLNENKNKKPNQMLTSSEDIIGMSQSQGIDNSVSSSALEGYDYFEEIEKKPVGNFLANKFGKKK